jgi:hypothetical protein
VILDRYSGEPRAHSGGSDGAFSNKLGLVPGDYPPLWTPCTRMQGQHFLGRATVVAPERSRSLWRIAQLYRK